jgi:hypothetical protein
MRFPNRVRPILKIDGEGENIAAAVAKLYHSRIFAANVHSCAAGLEQNELASFPINAQQRRT